MSDLADFLLARIAEDEAMARRCLPALEGGGVILIRLHTTETLPDGTKRTYTDEVSPYDPARVLAECEAKRRIVAEHPITDQVVGYGGGDHAFGCEVCHDWDGATVGHGFCVTLRALASVYADHADYRDEWKP